MITTFINLFIHCTPSTQPLYCYLYAYISHFLSVCAHGVSLSFIVLLHTLLLNLSSAISMRTRKYAETNHVLHIYRGFVLSAPRMYDLCKQLVLVLLSPSPPLLLLLFFFQFRFIIFLRRLPVPPLCDVFCDRVVLYW